MARLVNLTRCACLFALLLSLTGCEGGDDDDFLFFTIWTVFPLALTFAAVLSRAVFPPSQCDIAHAQAA